MPLSLPPISLIEGRMHHGAVLIRRVRNKPDQPPVSLTRSPQPCTCIFTTISHRVLAAVVEALVDRGRRGRAGDVLALDGRAEAGLLLLRHRHERSLPVAVPGELCSGY